jgi:hypothetical protein
MPKKQLDGAYVSARFQQVDGEGMTQGMRGDGFGNTGLLTGQSANEFNGAGRDGLAGQIAGKQPMLGPCLAPVVPQDVQQLGREHDVAVLAPFARVHADHHALAVDRLRRQAAGLGDPKPGRIANGQDDPVLRVLDCNQKAVDLVRAHNDWTFLWLAAGRDRVVDAPVPLQGDVVEETDSRDRDQDGAGRKALVQGEMQLIGSDIVRPKQVWRSAEVAGELGDLLQIGPPCVRREIAHLHVFGHALAK